MKPQEIQPYLQSLLDAPVAVLHLEVLGERQGNEVKGYGYGIPVKVEFQAGDQRRTAVFHTMAPGPFGHEHMADRAQEMLWEYHAFNLLPRHVRSLDVCVFNRADGLCLSAPSRNSVF